MSFRPLQGIMHLATLMTELFLMGRYMNETRLGTYGPYFYGN